MENVKKTLPRYSPKVREPAVRMVHEHRGEQAWRSGQKILLS